MPSTANTYRFRQLLDPNDILFQRREADLSVYSRMNPKEVQEIQNICKLVRQGKPIPTPAIRILAKKLGFPAEILKGSSVDLCTFVENIVGRRQEYFDNIGDTEIFDTQNTKVETWKRGYEMMDVARDIYPLTKMDEAIASDSIPFPQPYTPEQMNAWYKAKNAMDRQQQYESGLAIASTLNAMLQDAHIQDADIVLRIDFEYYYDRNSRKEPPVKHFLSSFDENYNVSLYNYWKEQYSKFLPSANNVFIGSRSGKTSAVWSAGNLRRYFNPLR